MKKLTLLAFLGLLVTALAQAEDSAKDFANNWPQWRGPEANGTAPHGMPPLKWDDKTNIKWKTELPGRGASTPIVWGDRIFILTAIDTGKEATAEAIPKPDPKFDVKTKPPTTYHQWVVQCIDRETGKLRWQQVAAEAVPHEGHHETHSYAASSPCTDGKFLYVSFGSRGIFCYDLDGKLQWKRDFGLLHTRFGWGECITPTLYQDSLVVSWDQEIGSFIACLDAKTGTTKWKVDRAEATSWNTPLVVPYKGVTQVIVNGTKRVRAYDLATGKTIWECGGQTINAIPSPVTADGVVYCMSGYRGSFACAISLDSTGDVTDKVLWKYGKATPYVPSPLLYGDRLYFTQANDALLTCLDTKTGKAVMDRERLRSLESMYASPVGATDRIYLTGRDGTTLVIKRGDKFEVLTTNRLNDPIDASPAIVGKQMFLRGQKYLYCIEEK